VLLEGGEAFAATIESCLERADAVVAIWSKASVASDWVRDEAAHGRGRKRLVPVSLDGCEPPLGFRQYHALDFSRWRGDRKAQEIASLVRGIAAVRGAEMEPRQPARRGLSRRALLIGGGAAALAAGGGFLAWTILGPKRASNSVAVLPFANLSGDAAQSYFSDGLSEEVRAALARNPRLRVAAPTSSASFRESGEDAKTIAGRLGVAFLLEGSVRRSGDKVRIAADLVDAKTGFSAWSQSFERRLDDIFAVQSEIARTVVEALSVRISSDAPPPGGTANVAAFDALLRGRALFNSDVGEESDRAALAQYDAAIAADPNYAAAHAARSRVLAAMAAQYGKAEEHDRAFRKAVESARRAVAIAPDLAEAQLALGYALFAGRVDFRAAAEPYRRARELGRGDADILLLSAIYSARAGRGDEARQAIERALARDPLNPRTHRAAGSIHYASRRFPEAIAAARRALALNPGIANAHAAIGNVLVMTGKMREARAEYALESNPSFRLAGLAIAEWGLGNRAAAAAALAQLRSELGDSALYQQGQVLAMRGDKDGAIAALVRGRAAGDAGITAIGSDPMLEALREEPRFLELRKAIGLA